LNDKALILHLRWLAILLAFGLVQLESPAYFTDPVIAGTFLAYVASNIALARLAPRRMGPGAAWFLLVLFDITVVSAIIFKIGRADGDAFFLYLPAVAWAACHQGQRGIFGAVGASAGAYALIQAAAGPDGVLAAQIFGETGFLFRMSLLVVIGIFFGYLAQQLRDEAAGNSLLAAERKELETVVTAAHVFSATLSQKEVLNLLIQEAVELVGGFRCSVIYVDEARTSGTLLISREMMERRDRLGERTLRIVLNNYPELARALDTREVVVVDEVARTPFLALVADKVKSLGIRSILVVPMAIDDPVVGTLLFSVARSEGPFTPREIKLCELLTAVAANVLKNAYMHESLTNENLSLQKLAISDPLTGCYNRRFFDMRLSEEFRLAVRHHLPLSLLLLDIDHFKRINDTHGHPVGDRVLVKVAELVQGSLRHSDCLARYGGEEFILLLPLTDRRGAMAKAEEIRLAIKAMSFDVDPDEMRLTVSLGVSAYDPGISTDPESLIALSDQALYAAKQGGRDQVRFTEGSTVLPEAGAAGAAGAATAPAAPSIARG
jgi:diguanylate cyclase (GGDEF)-like protein